MRNTLRTIMILSAINSLSVSSAKTVRKRFDDELIDLLLKLKWWNKSVEEINALIPFLSCSDLAKVKQEIKSLLA